MQRKLYNFQFQSNLKLYTSIMIYINRSQLYRVMSEVLCVVCLLERLSLWQTTVNRIGLKPYGMPGEVADDSSRLGDCSIIEPSLLHPFVLQCGLDVPTVPRYDCALPSIIPNSAKAAFAYKKESPAPWGLGLAAGAELSEGGDAKRSRPYHNIFIVANLYPCGKSKTRFLSMQMRLLTKVNTQVVHPCAIRA